MALSESWMWRRKYNGDRDCSTSIFWSQRFLIFIVENNFLSPESIPKGLQDYGQAVASWDQYAEANNLTPEQKQAGLDRLAKGKLPESANIAKVIVDGYKNGVLIAEAAYPGQTATVGKAAGDPIIGAIANGAYQWFDINSERNQSLPESQQKTWDYKSSVSAGITGSLAPGRGVWQNVGIASGGALFSGGPDVGSVGGATVGAWAGGMFGEYIPEIVSSVSGKEIPGFIFDATGSFGSELLEGYIKDAINSNQTSPERNKEGEK